jgi:hypothetical protein
MVTVLDVFVCEKRERKKNNIERELLEEERVY